MNSGGEQFHQARVSARNASHHTRGSETCVRNSNCTVSCKHTYVPATRVYGPGYYLLPARDINHGYPCGVSASTFCIKRNETQRNGCLRKGNSGIGNCAWRSMEKIGIRGRRNYIFRCLEPRKSVPLLYESLSLSPPGFGIYEEFNSNFFHHFFPRYSNNGWNIDKRRCMFTNWVLI